MVSRIDLDSILASKIINPSDLMYRVQANQDGVQNADGVKDSKNPFSMELNSVFTENMKAGSLQDAEVAEEIEIDDMSLGEDLVQMQNQNIPELPENVKMLLNLLKN